MQENKAPKDRNGTPLSGGDFVRVFLEHTERPDHTAKVLYTGEEKSTLEPVGGRGIEHIDNQNLEVL